MRTKKYWQDLSERHYRDLQEARNLLDIKNQALMFLLKSPDTYRVELKSDVRVIGTAPYSLPTTHFNYVDGAGKYHTFCRAIAKDQIEIISVNAETAVFRVLINKDRPIYWILNKTDETIADMPEELICHRGTKICEEKCDG